MKLALIAAAFSAALLGAMVGAAANSASRHLAGFLDAQALKGAAGAPLRLGSQAAPLLRAR